MRVLITIAAILATNLAFGATVTLDFNEPGLEMGEVVPDSTTFWGPIQSKGFELAPEVEGSVTFATNGGPDVILAWGPSGGVAFSASDGRLFELDSVDLGSALDGEISVTGYYAAGGTVDMSFANIGSFQLTTIEFDSTWQGLDQVVFTTPGAGLIDTIVVQTVPVPAALWLFSGALACLMRFRRV